MDKTVLLRDKPEDLGKIVWNSLLTLGFKLHKLPHKDYAQGDISIFKKMNQSVGNEILHFLFTCINYHQAAKVFRNCWPILDKKLETQFRNSAFEWYKSLNQREHFNLKPSLIVSKAVMTPTSNKFFATVYALTRMALQSKINHKGPSLSFIYYPHLAAKIDHRHKVVKLIKKSKIYHFRHYKNSMQERRIMLENYCKQAKELIQKYRELLKKKASLEKEKANKIQESHILTFKKKEILSTASLNEFNEELLRPLREMNSSIKTLWLKNENFRKREETSWSFIFPLVKGNTSFTCIDGQDFHELQYLKTQNMFHEEKKIQSCFIGKYLDLFHVFQVSRNALSLMENFSQTLKNEKGQRIWEHLQETESQSKCVLSIRNEKRDIELILDEMLQPLIQSVSEMRQKCEAQFDYKPCWQSESLELCPPTPALQFENLSPQVRKSRSSRNFNSSGKGASLKDTSFKKRNYILQNSQSAHWCYMKNDNSAISLTPSNLATVDSGCILSYGMDSLLQALDKLDVTPKYKKDQSIQRTSKVREVEGLKLDFNEENLSLDDSGTPFIHEKSLVEPECGDNYCQINIKPHTQSNAIINLANFSVNKETRSSDISKDKCFSVNQLNYLNLKNNNGKTTEINFASNQSMSKFNFLEGAYLCSDECSGIIPKTILVNQSPKQEIKYSPTASKLLQNLRAGSESKFFESKLNLSLDDMSDEMKNSYDRCEPEVSSPSLNQKSSLKSKGMKANSMESCQTTNPNSSLPFSIFKESIFSHLASVESWPKVEGTYLKKDMRSPKMLTSAMDNVLESNKNKLNYEMEEFVDSKDYFEEKSSSLKLSHVLPRNSIFDTVTESFIAGELDLDLALTEQAAKEVKRESLTSRFDSLQTKNKIENLNVSRLSDLFNRRFSLECSDLLDESGSFLLSTSVDAI